MRAVICPVPLSDPRPQRFSQAVAKRTARSHLVDVRGALSAILENAQGIGVARPMPSDDEIVTTLANCIAASKRAQGDGFAMAAALSIHWPVDTALARVIFRVAESLDFHKRLETEDWSLRLAFAKAPVDAQKPQTIERSLGSKPPAREGDHIEWLEPGAINKAGEVISLNRAQRELVVKPIDTLDAFQPKRIVWEVVTANITQCRYATPDQDGGSLVIELPDPELLPLTPPRAPLVDPDKTGSPPPGPMVA